jgi:hypothetical protein
MADKVVSAKRKISTYGGYKTEYIEVASMDSADVLKLDAKHGEVMDISLNEKDDTNGWAPLSFAVGGTSKNELTLKTAAKTGIKVVGSITYKAK